MSAEATRELRELVRHRANLVALRTGLRSQVRAILAKEGVRASMSDRFGVARTRLLDDLELGDAFAKRVASLRELLAGATPRFGVLRPARDRVGGSGGPRDARRGRGCRRRRNTSVGGRGWAGKAARS